MKKQSWIHKITQLFILKVKFASSSLLATAVDYLLYLLLVGKVFIPEIAHIVSATAGMLINFFLQKKYVFLLNRKATTAFAISVLVSILGILLGSLMIHLLTEITFFNQHQYITKLIVTGTIFFYNFYLKRFAFEKKFF